MPRSLGEQALGMARDLSAMNRDEEYARSRALRDQLSIKKSQKEALTKAWAAALVKNPEVAKQYPADAPPGVLFSAQILASEADRGNLAKKRQQLAVDAETYKQDLGGAQAALTTNDESIYMGPVLKALGRVRDGRSGYRVEPNGDWSYIRDSDKTRQYMAPKSAKWLSDYFSAHDDIKGYITRKTADINRKDDNNRKAVLNGKTWVSKDGQTTATVIDGLVDSKGNPKPKRITIHSPNGPHLVEGPEATEQFYNDYRSVKGEKQKAEVAKAHQEINKPQPATIKWGGRTITRRDARAELKTISSNVFKKGSAAMDFVAKLLAPRAVGKAFDPSTLDTKEVGSILSQAQEIYDDKTSKPLQKAAAKKFIGLFKALIGMGGGEVGKNTQSNWRDYR